MAKSFAFVLSKNKYPDGYQAKLIGVDQGTRIVYATTATLTSANILYADSKLVQPIYGDPTAWYGIQLLTNEAVKYAVEISALGVINPVADPTTTTSTTTTTTTTSTTTTTTSTTTTTTAAPGPFEYGRSIFNNPDAASACAGGVMPSSTGYSDQSDPALVTVLYTDPELTTPISGIGSFVAYYNKSNPSVIYAARVAESGAMTENTAC